MTGRMIKAVILAGGQGTRLRPLTCNMPKGMVPILNRPFLEHLLCYLKHHGVEEVVLALGHRSQQIEESCADGSLCGVKLTCVAEETPLGTAGAVKNAERYLDGPFLVFNGDIFTDIHLGRMYDFHRQRKARATIALTEVEDPSHYGVVVMNARQRVQRFIEKPPRESAPSHMINAGVYILEPSVLEDVPANTPFMFEHHLFPLLLEKGAPVYGYSQRSYWIDMGTIGKYLQVHHDLLGGRCSCSIDLPQRGPGIVHPTARISGQVILGDGCVVGAGACIEGPASLGAGCVVGEDAHIVGSVLWEKVTVGRGARLRHCIIAANGAVGDGSVISDGSVLGEGVAIPPGVTLPPGTVRWPEGAPELASQPRR